MRITQKRLALRALAAACCLSLMAPAARAQGESSSAAAGQAADTTGASTPQNAPGPVGGVEGYRLAGPSLGPSFIVPRFSVQEMYNSNAGFASTTGGSQADALTSLNAGFSLQWVKRESTLSLDYSAGGLLYALQTQPNGTLQQLGVTQKLNLRRWNLLFGENFSYLPASQFGLGGLGGLGNPGGGNTLTGLPGTGGVTNFNPFTTPSQTIGSPNVSQLSSTSVVQAQYLIGAQSSINGSVSAGFLHFFGDNLLNSRDIVARLGYDRSLTARDTFNVSYTASVLTYPSGIQGFYSQYFQVGYRRIVTGRLHLSVSAGPVLTHFSPASGQTTVPGGQNSVDWSLFGSLEYALRNGVLNVNYNHGVTGGSGFFVGAVTDQVSGNFSHRLTRVWTATLTGSFAHNSSFQQTTPMGGAVSTAAFNYWTAGVSASRPIGHYSSVRFFYNAQKQTTNTTTCANALACGPIALVQVAGVSFSWSTRPYKLD
jgi:hypothetical protein